MSQHALAVSDASFDAEVLQSELPVLVDFWAEWCGPCKMIGPIVEDLAAHSVGKLKVFKLNVDENSEMPVKYQVRGIPTLILFHKGQVLGTKVGVLTKSQLQAFIDELI